MAKNKSDVNKNFENLKAQMKKKRELAETVKKVIENETIETPINDINNTLEINLVENNNESNITTKNEYENTNEYINNNVNTIVDDSENIIENNNEDINKINSLPEETNYTINENFMLNTESMPTGSEYVARKTGMVSDININKIVIKKVEKQEQPKRITYYLRPETIKKIDRFSKLSGMGKSEFVQKILDEVLNNLEIEK